MFNMTAIHELKFDGIELKDVIRLLRNTSGLDIHVEWDRLDSVGVGKNNLVSLCLQNTTLHAALALCLTEVAAEGVLGYIIRGGTIHISTPEGLREIRESATAKTAPMPTRKDL